MYPKKLIRYVNTNCTYKFLYKILSKFRKQLYLTEIEITNQSIIGLSVTKRISRISQG